MTKIKGKNVLVTGGASGIGRLMGEACLKKGAKSLIIWDVNRDALLKTSKELNAEGYKVYAYQVDVSDHADVESAAFTATEDIGPVDIVFNNAGIVVGKEFAEHSALDIKRSLDINVAGVMYVALEFLQGMLKRNQGHIINIASASSFLPNPRMSVYAASKAAVLSWSESLRLEMERGKTDVKITTVAPSYINTGMFDGVKAPLLTPIMEPHEIVKEIMDAVEEDEILLKAPFMVNAAPMLRGILPPRLFDMVADVMGVYNSMDKFQGHKLSAKDAPKSEAKREIPKKKQATE
jgi:short-subunit dehydrogenase